MNQKKRIKKKTKKYQRKMTLKKWTKKKRILNKWIADDLGVHISYMSLLINEKRRPSYDLAKKIAKYTNNEVTIETLMRQKNLIKK